MGLLEQVIKEGSPLIHGETVTFIWQGIKHPHLIGDFNGWENDEGVTWSRAGKGLWKVEIRFPADAYVEYAFTTPISCSSLAGSLRNVSLGPS